MLSRDSIIQLAALLVFAVCVASSGALTHALTAEAGRAQLVYTDEATEGDPPEVALGIAMGAFRGLFVNYLWIRANKLKQDGKFFEAMQLSTAITRLQPRFPRVWAFQAWNMAYNISVATNTAEERWQWVKAGIDLLRDQGIPRNPNDTLLHKELAWIFVHKVQGFADDANHYYKREMAREWTILLGIPPRMDGTTEENTEKMAEWLTPILRSPDSLEEVFAQEIAAQEKAGVGLLPDGTRQSLTKELVGRIRTEARLEPGKDLLRFVEYRLAWARSYHAQETHRELSAIDRNDAIDALMLDERYTDAWPRLLAFTRRRVLLEMHMEPERMQRYTRLFGPLDWRHPASHALYWSRRGVEEGLERDTVTQFDTLNTDRVTVHAIQELFRYGTIQYDLWSNDYYAMTDFDWAEAYGEALEDLMNEQRGGIAADPTQRAYTMYGAGYENFLRDVIRTAYNRGDVAIAEKFHEKLRKFGGLNLNDPDLVTDLKMPLADFVMKGLKDRLTTPYVALQEIESAIMDAILRGLGQGKPEVFSRQMEYAQRVRDAYLEVQNIRTNVDAETNRMAEFVGGDFAEIVARVYVRLLAGGSFGDIQLGPIEAGRIFRRTPVELQRRVYDQLIAIVVRGNPWMTPEQAAEFFPEPSGMKEFREALEGTAAEQERRRKEQIEFQKK